MSKLICVVMGDNCTNFLDMCFDSIIDADKIVFLWGCDDIKTKEMFLEWQNKYSNKFHLLEYRYNQDDKGQNGKSRNFYLKYLQENHPEEWVLCMDADEVLAKDGILNIKKYIEAYDISPLKVHSVHMRHLIFFLNQEDNTVEKHYVLHRLFKVSDNLSYPLLEHPVLQGEDLIGKCDATTIWHLAYIPGLWDIKRRYENHLAKSNMHTPEYLRQWRNAHYFGTYPRKQFDPQELPDQILKNFGIDRDELYFENRKKLEPKHMIDAADWALTFKPNKVLLCGDGMGHRTYALRRIGIDATGFDVSLYAVMNSPYNIGSKYLFCDNIIDDMDHWKAQFDLVVAYDILEHLTYDQLDIALRNCEQWTTKYLLVSVPTVGDPNLLADKTHLIHETKEWWQNKIAEHGFKILSTPEHFLFQEQLILMFLWIIPALFFHSYIIQ